eukprot:scaffold30384_cov53-Attheya_sp.AAC.13
MARGRLDDGRSMDDDNQWPGEGERRNATSHNLQTNNNNMRHGWGRCRDDEPRLTVKSYAVARAFLLLVLLSLLLAPAVDAAVPINVNLKSATLSNVLNDKKNTHNPSSTQQTSSGEPSPESREGTKQKSPSSFGGVSLDLSGNFQCHLLGDDPAAAADEETNVNPQKTTPIFQCHNLRHDAVPSVHMGSHYNFGKVWYGATRLFTTMTWKFTKPPRIRENEGVIFPTSELVEETNNGYSNRGATTIRRHQIQLRGDKGLLSAGDYGIELGVESSASPQGHVYSKSAKLSSTANVRLETGGIGKGNVPKVTLSVSTNAAVNPRIRFVSQTTRFLGTNDGSFFASRIPTPPQTMDDWMPDIKIAASGRLMGKCHVGVGKRRKTGIRLLVSKQLDWNVWSGGAPSESNNDSGDTHIRCELCNLNSVGDELSSVSVDTVLERIVEAAHMTLSHERIICS